MKALKLAWRLLLRDWKSGQLGVLLFALTLAVSSLTAVAFLTDRVGQAVNLRASESLAADLRLGSSQKMDPAYLQTAQLAGLQTASIVSMPSVVFAADNSTLAAIRAVSENYPLRGQLKVANTLMADAYVERAIPASGEAWASTRLLARLGLNTGARIKVGNTSLLISRVLDYRPDQGMQFVDLAPTLLINQADLNATGLIRTGSRVSYRYLFAGPVRALTSFKKRLKEKIKASEQLSDIEDVSPQIREAMQRAGRFLNLASLISVLLASIAVAMAARRYAFRHRDRVALLKCLGAQRRFIFQLNLFQLFMLTIVSAIAGVLIGYGAQQLLVYLGRDLIAQALPPASAGPVLLGFVTAVCILAGFALPDLLQMARTPVLRVLRSDVDTPALRYGLGYLAGILAVLVLLQYLVGDLMLVLWISMGAGISFILLGMAGWLLVKLTGRFRGAAGVAWRYGLANLNRRGRESIIQVVAFGLGLMVLMLLTLVRNDLMDSWRASLPANAPNQFLINIQANEIPLITQFLSQRNMEVPEFVPLVRARLNSINGVLVHKMKFTSPQAKRWTRRESNLSFSPHLQVGNEILSGQWWPEDTLAHEVSVDQQFATDLQLQLGDELGFDVAGEPVTAVVSSFRSVQWDSFMPNFFMVFSPATLADYPASYIAAFFVAGKDQQNLFELMHQFPSVTAIDIDAALAQVRDVMDKAALAVQAVFLFTLFAGLAVLWASVQSSLEERAYESAILRTLGSSRARVLTGVAVEFLAIGLLAGLMASSVASLAAWQLAQNVFDLDYHFSALLWVIGPFAGMLIVGLAGLLASWKAVNHSPELVLRAG